MWTGNDFPPFPRGFGWILVAILILAGFGLVDLLHWLWWLFHHLTITVN
jgi:hypothetical protein